MTITFGKLKKNHQALIVQYIDMLNQVSKLPFFAPVIIVKRKETSERSPGRARLPQELSFPFALRYLVRLFTESHIKGKLIELSMTYSFLTQEYTKDKRFVTWLKETSADCEKLAATLTSWQSISGIISGLWPVGIGIVTAWLNLENIYDIVKTSSGEPVDWVTVGLVIFPMIYVLGFIGYSFQKKREMFLRGFMGDTKQSYMDSPAKIDNIVYSLEDQVFDLVGRGKVREFPADVIGQTSVFLGFAAMGMTIWMVEPPGLSRIFFGGEVVFFLILAVASIFQLRWRKWT